MSVSLSHVLCFLLSVLGSLIISHDLLRMGSDVEVYLLVSELTHCSYTRAEVQKCLNSFVSVPHGSQSERCHGQDEFCGIIG